MLLQFLNLYEVRVAGWVTTCFLQFLNLYEVPQT